MKTFIFNKIPALPFLRENKSVIMCCGIMGKTSFQRNINS